MKLIFLELEEGKDENLENATNCVIELISMSRRKPEFEGIRQAVIMRVEHLTSKVDQAVQS